MDLKVNVFDSTLSGEVTIVLSMDKFNEWDNIDLIEEGISLAASLGSLYTSSGMSVEIISNGIDTKTGDALRIPEGSSINHNIIMYEGLARLETGRVRQYITDFLSSEIHSGRKGRVIVFASHYYSEDLKATYLELREKGFNIKWILLKEKESRVKIDNLEDLYIWEVRRQ
jgi:hypothetical protein